MRVCSSLRARGRVRLLLGAMVFACGASACARNEASPTSFSPSPTAPSTAPPADPAPQLAVMTGRVSETAPTSIVGVPSARVAVAEGADAGMIATATAEGSFALSGLRPGPMTLTASAEGFESRSQTLVVRDGGFVSFQLNPTFEILRFTIPGDIAAEDGTCSDGVDQKPCRIVSFPVHNAGPIGGSLQWQEATTDLDLNLFETSAQTLVPSQQTSTGSTIQLQAQASANSRYELHITYARGHAGTEYTLQLSYPR